MGSSRGPGSRLACLAASLLLGAIGLCSTSASSALAAEAGQIAGTVTSASTKEPIAGIEVCAFEPLQFINQCAKTNASGGYTIAELQPASYQVYFFSPEGSGLNYVWQYYNGRSSFSEADVVTVEASQTKSGIDASLQTGGQIGGTVTSAATKGAIAGIQVCAEDNSGGACARTDSSGKYTVSGLSSGSYHVSFAVFESGGLNYLPQYYNGKSSFSEGEAVPVVAGNLVPGIDAALVAGGQIAGKVTDASTKAAAEGVEVCAYRAQGGPISCVNTNTSGEYTIAALDTGEYKVEFSPYFANAKYVTQYFDGKISSSEADSVSVVAGAVTPGVNAAMVVGGEIKGRATSAATKAAMGGVDVCASPGNGGNGHCAFTNASGEYAIEGLASGEYTVSFSTFTTPNILSQYYNGKLSSFEADLVTVTAGSATLGIDAAMATGGQITGKVTDSLSKAPLAGIEVCPSVVSGSGGFCTTTNASGEYTIASLATGEYKLNFFSPTGEYFSQYYNGAPSFSEAVAVAVTAGNTTSGIDVAMVAGGKIAGTVTSATDKSSLAGVYVCAHEQGEIFFGRCATTNSAGEYKIVGLSTGKYSVSFEPSGNYLSQYYNGESTAGKADLVSVAEGITVTGIDAALASGGRFAGKVTSEATKAALEDVEVCATKRGEEYFEHCAGTNSAGEYTIVGLPTGEYTVAFRPFAGNGMNYLPQYYNGKTSFSEANPVSATAGSTTAGIDAALVVGGQIAGKVTDASTKAGIGGVQVCASKTGGEGGGEGGGGCTTTAASGEYILNGLSTGGYTVRFSTPTSGSNQYVEQYYNGKSSFSEATQVSITTGSLTSGIDAAMVPKGKITGTVTDASTKAPIGGITVCPLTSTGSFGGQCATTNSSGNYTIVGLAAGEYKVQFSVPYGGLNYLEQYYSNATSVAEATAVSVSLAAVTSGVNAAMVAGGVITGKVTNASTKTPLAGIIVCPQSSILTSFQCATSNAKGEYKLIALSTGSYKVEFFAGGAGNFVAQYYNGKQSSSEADSVSVTAGSTTSSIDAAMVLGGKIAGKVTDASTKAVVPNIEVCASPASGGIILNGGCAYSNSNGEYSIPALPTGEYKVEFYANSNSNYLAQYYNGKEALSGANPVAVTAGATTPNIDAGMVKGATITGRVTYATTKTGIYAAEVCVRTKSTGSIAVCAFTNNAGEYTAAGLPTGEYKVEFSSFNEGLSTQYYNDKGTLAEADAVSATAGSTTPGIDAAMVVGGEIVGTVTSTLTKAGIASIQVCAEKGGTEPIRRCTTTNSSGEYVVAGLASGEYKVEFRPLAGVNYVPQYYDGKGSFSEATPVSVVAGSPTSGIDAHMTVGGQIVGKVTDASTKAPLGGIQVCPLTSSGLGGACTSTNASGEYTIAGLPTGEYKLEFYPVGSANYIPQFYNDKDAVSEADAVAVTAGEIVSGVNAAMIVGGQIAGKVTNASTKAAASGLEVCARSKASQVFSTACASTNSSGEYKIVGLASGEYTVEFLAGTQNYLTQFYNGKALFVEADPVSVTAGSTTPGIDAAMVVAGQITGRVTDASTKSALAGIEVCSSAEAGGFFSRCTTTGANGEYAIVGLVTGQYDVRFTSPGNSYASQYYNAKTSLVLADAVGVTTGSATGGIDAQLANLPTEIAPPTITGTAQQAHTLTEAHGTWANGPTGYLYQWELCDKAGAECRSVSGATGQTYVPVLADAGHTLRVTETATNVAGASTPAVSAATPIVLPLPPVNTTPPSISGTAQQDKTLSESQGLWENAPTSYGYQWQRCDAEGTKCLAISGATSQTYVPTSADVGHRLVVDETASNAGGEGEPAVSPATAVVVPPVPVNTTVPSLSGNAAQGQTLTEAHGSWENSPTSYSYEWERCEALAECVPIEGATEQSYLLRAADVGHTIKVVEVAVNAGGPSAPAASAASAKVVASPPVDLEAPSISGTAQQGQKLVEAHGSWSNEPTGYTYRWLRCDEEGKNCAAISGATIQFYVPVVGDVGHTLKIEETADNAAGPGSPATSSPTSVVVPPVPVNSAPPAISGSPVQGQTLSESHGSWSNAPTSYEYQWLRCDGEGKSCTAISGAGEQTYTPLAADVGHTLVVEETAINAGGSGQPAVSSATATVAAAKPVAVHPPSISGTAQQGDVLAEEHGDWTNEPTSYEYQWRRCDSEGKNCTAISSATLQSYTLTSADVGHTVEVLETATNAAGPSSPASSQATAVVLPPVPVNVDPPTISGAPRQGGTLTETHGSWTNSPTEYLYQWLQCDSMGTGCVPISGGTGQTYSPTAQDVGHVLEVQEIAANAGGQGVPVMSVATATVVAVPPVNIGPPSIAGVAQQGETLTEEHGSWENEPTSFTYQWQRCDAAASKCAAISGAVGQSYVAAAADVGHTLVVVEVAGNAGGTSGPVTSSPTAVVVPPVPVDVKPPSIEGPAIQGEVMAAVDGSWTNEPTGYAHQWLRCTSTGGGCQAIAGAESQTYVPSSADVGHALKVSETATNAGGPSQAASSASSKAILAPPLHADAGEGIAATTGVPVSFDGNGSSPSRFIDGYRWEFGDGASGEGASVTHSYSVPGVYTAKLTITDGSASTSASTSVTVTNPPPAPAQITVLDGGGQPIPGAEVLYIGSSGARTEAYAGGDGVASLSNLPDGTDTVYAYQSGYQPAAGQVLVSGGTGQATIHLSSGAVATSILKSHEMNLKEIEEAGIDTNDPANQLVFEFTVRLSFIESPTPPVEFHCHVNAGGKFVGECGFGGGSGGGGGGGGGGGCCGGGGSGGGCDSNVCYGPGVAVVSQVVEGHPLIEWLVLRGKATILKQFFNVSMVVQNLSPEPFKLTGGGATLNVPSGMSLAPTSKPQDASQSVPDIPGMGSATVNWVLRGDIPGEYRLSAEYHGSLQPFNAPVDLQAVQAEALKVWGSEALLLSVKADSGMLAEGYPYHVTIGITNKSTIPLYNVGLSLDAEVHERFIFQPDQSFVDTVGELKPGQTLYSHPYVLVPDAASVSNFNPALSSAAFDGEEIHPGEGIEAVSPPPTYAIQAPTDTPNMVHLHWQQVPGAEGYEVFPTVNLDTPFGETPDSVLESPTSETGVSLLPASATSAYIFADPNEKPKYYAVSSIVGGRPTLAFPVIQASAGREPPSPPGSGSGGTLGSINSSSGSDNGLGAPARTCAHNTFKAGGITVEASCFTGTGTLTASGHIRVNGIDIVSSGEVTLNTSTLELTSKGKVDVYAGSLLIFEGTLDWSLHAQLSLKVPSNLKIKGLPIKGEITISLVEGGADAVANATVGGKFTVSGAVDLEVTLADGLKLNLLELSLSSDLPIKSLIVKKASIAYQRSSGKDIWKGDVAVQLPGSGPTIDGSLTIDNGSVSEVAVNVSGINKPIGEVVFLQSLGLKVNFIPRLAATGSIGLSGGPSILGHTAVGINGSLTAEIGNPFVIEAKGSLSLVDDKLASASVKATIPGGVEFAGSISQSFLALKLEAGIRGKVMAHEFEAQGNATVSLGPASASGDALVNNAGLAGCAEASIGIAFVHGTVRIGGSHRWSGENSLFTDACGFSRLQQALGARSSAVPAPAILVTVAPHTRQINLIVKGNGGPPEVALGEGQSTTVVKPNTIGTFAGTVYLAAADPTDNETDIAIAKPPAGKLEVSAPPGQTGLSSVGSTVSLPSPHVQVKLVALGARRYRLRWRSRPIAGQTLVFEDADSRGQVTLRTTGKPSGQFEFSAREAGADGAHKLRVAVEQDGLLREAIDVASFHPAPLRLKAPHVRLRAHGRDLLVSWSAVHGAASYDVYVVASDGRKMFFSTPATQRSLRVAGAHDVLVRVQAINVGLRSGSAASASIRVKQAQRPRGAPRR